MLRNRGAVLRHATALALALALCLAMSGAAHAARPYLGLGAGHGHMQHALSLTDPAGIDRAHFDGVGGNGTVLTGFAGVEWAAEPFRIAVELDGSIVRLESTLWGEYGYYAVDGWFRTEWCAILSALLFYDVVETASIFARVGYGSTSYSARIVSEAFGANDDPYGDVQFVALGLGLEARLSEKWALRGEFLHHDYEEFQGEVEDIGVLLASSINTTQLSIVRRF